MSLILAVLLQVGPAPGAASPSQLPREIVNRKPRVQARPQPPEPPATPAGKEKDCIEGIAGDPQGTAESAELWRDGATGQDRALADLCLGMALSQTQDLSGAEAAFLDGREALGGGILRARLGSMAGSAALAQGASERALGLLDTATIDLGGERTGPLPLAIAIDRASALVMLGRLTDAEAPLAEARGLAPTNAEAWLLSATLSRRQGNLVQAQAQIEKAVDLLPIDPEIGLEAGLIAVLSGRDDAARKSWQSVIAAAPKSQAAETARGYLVQLSAPRPPALPSAAPSTTTSAVRP